MPYFANSFNQTDYADNIKHAEEALKINDIQSAQESYCNAYRIAENLHSDSHCIECLVKLSELYALKKDFHAAAKLLNAALLTLGEKQFGNVTADDIKNKLAKIEHTYLSEKCQISNEKIKLIELANQQEHLRQAIIKFRTNIKPTMHKESAQNLSFQISTFFRQLMQQVIDIAVKALGKTPCNYAVFCLGSMSRNEMSLFSDCEYGFFIETDTPSIQTHFKKINEYAELIVINLGETECKIEGLFIKPHWPLSGFSFDSGMTPLGAVGISLMTTPKKLAELQTPAMENSVDVLTRSTLRNADYLMGEHTLFTAYEKYLHKILHTALPKKEQLKYLCQQQALALMEMELSWYEPQLNQKKELTPFFNVKHELYRLLNNVINNLALYHQLQAKNTWQRLVELKKRQLITDVGQRHLAQAMESITNLRLRTHLHYDTEKEDIYHPHLLRDPHISPEIIKAAFPLEDKDIQTLFEIYKVLLPLYKAAKLFCESKGKTDLFKTNDFYDESFAVQGKASEKLYQYEKAKQYYQQAAAVNPDDIEILIHLGWMLRTLGEYKTAQIYFQKTLALDTVQQTKALADKARVLDYLGIIAGDLGQYSEKKKLLEEALSSKQTLYDPEHFEMIKTQANLARVYLDLGQPKKSQALLEKIITIKEEKFSNDYSVLLRAYNDLDAIYIDLGLYQQGQVVLEKALVLGRRVYGEQHPLVAITYANLGLNSGYLGNYQQKKVWVEQALAIEETIYGSQHPSVATTFSSLGGAYSDLGNYQQQKIFYEKAFAIREKIYDETHPNIAYSLINLALAYGNLGQYKKKKELLERGFQIELKVFSEKSLEYNIGLLNDIAHDIEHPWLATTLRYLANAYGEAGEYQKKKELLEQALKIQRDVYGEMHPSVAYSLGDLGDAYGFLGNYTEQLHCYEQELKIVETIYDKSHPRRSYSLRGLAFVYGNLGQYQKKKELLEEVLQIQEQAYGKDHPTVANTLGYLGDAYGILGQYQKKKELLEQALPTQEQAYGKDHPTVANTLGYLGDAYSSLGLYSDSQHYYKESLRIKQKAYGEQHPAVATALTDVAFFYGKQGKFGKKKKLLRQALKIRKQFNGKSHPSVATAKENLADAYDDLGKYEQALKLAKSALRIKKKFYEAEHPAIATCLTSLAQLYGQLSKNKKKKKILRQVLAMEKKIYGTEQHPNIADTFEELGMAYGALGNHEKEKKFIEKALIIEEKFYGTEHPVIAGTLSNLADAHEFLGEHQQRKNLLERALAIYQKVYDNKDHPDIARVLLNLGNTYGDLGDYRIQREMLEKALAIEEKFYATDHPSLNTTRNNLACYYHSIGRIENNHECLKKAEEFFLLVLTTEAEGSDYIDYCHLLSKSQRYTEVITYIEKVLAEKVDEEDTVYYANGTKMILPDALVAEVSEEKTIEIPAALLGYYLLIDAYCNTQQIDQAFLLLPKFTAAIEHYDEPFGYALLGYGHKLLEQYVEAAQWFEKAWQADEEYELAKQNQQACLKWVNAINLATGDNNFLFSTRSSAMQSAHKNQTSTVKEWETQLKQLTDINQQDTHKTTWLMRAVEKGDVPLVTWLLEKGANSLIGNLDNKTPLHIACVKGSIEIVNLLLAKSAAKENLLFARDSAGEIPFHKAAYYGHKDILQICLANADKTKLLEAKDAVGKTALHFAAFNADANVARYLIEQGAVINQANQHGYTPLHFSARSGHHQVSQLLIDLGADLTCETVDKKTPIHIAEAFNHSRLAEQIRAALLIRLTQQQLLQNEQQEQQRIENEKETKFQPDNEFMQHLTNQLEEFKKAQNALQEKIDQLDTELKRNDASNKKTELNANESDENTPAALAAMKIQLHELAAQQTVLMQTQALKLQKQQAMKDFADHPNLLLFYRAIQIKFEELYISSKAASGGFVNLASGKATQVKESIELLGELVSLAPIVGNAFNAIIKFSTGKALDYIDEQRQTNTVKSISYLMTLTELKKIGERIARQLTYWFEPQLKNLLTPAEIKQAQPMSKDKKLDKAKVKVKVKEKIKEGKKRILKENALAPAQMLAEYAIAAISQALVDHALKEEEALEQQFIALVTLQTSPKGIQMYEQQLLKRLGVHVVTTQAGEQWSLLEIFTKTGIRTAEGHLYVASGNEAAKYGYCNGTETAAKNRGLHYIGTHASSHHKEISNASVIPINLPPVISQKQEIELLQKQLIEEKQARLSLEKKVGELTSEIADIKSIVLQMRNTQSKSSSTQEELTNKNWGPSYFKNS